MSQEHINYGTAPNDGTGDTLRESQRKAESNFNELYAAIDEEASSTVIIDGENTTVTGTGTSIDPYQINVPDIGGSQNLQQTLENGTDAIFGEPGVENYAILGLLSSDGLGSWNSTSIISNADSSAESGYNHDLTQFVFSGSKDGISSNMGISNGEFLLQTTAPGNKSTSVGLVIPIGNSNQIDIPAPNSNEQQYYFGTSVNGQKFDSTGNVNISGGGAVDSVNGETGPVVLDQDDILDGTTYKQYSATEKTKLAGIATGATANTGTVTNVTGVSGETTVANGTTTPVIGISSTYTTARTAYADAKVENNLTASTTVAPSKTAVNSALANYVDISSSQTVTGAKTINTLTIPSSGFSITGSSGNAYFLRADGSQSPLPFGNTVQATVIGVDTGANAPITASMGFRMGVWNLQKQISFLQMLNVVHAVSTYALPVTNNQVYVTHTGTTATYTLPTLANGTAIQYTIINMGSGSITLNSNAGASDIYDGGTSSAAVTILAGQTAVIYGNGSKFVIL